MVGQRLWCFCSFWTNGRATGCWQSYWVLLSRAWKCTGREESFKLPDLFGPIPGRGSVRKEVLESSTVCGRRVTQSVHKPACFALVVSGPVAVSSSAVAWGHLMKSQRPKIGPNEAALKWVPRVARPHLEVSTDERLCGQRLQEVAWAGRGASIARPPS